MLVGISYFALGSSSANQFKVASLRVYFYQVFSSTVLFDKWFRQCTSSSSQPPEATVIINSGSRLPIFAFSVVCSLLSSSCNQSLSSPQVISIESIGRGAVSTCIACPVSRPRDLLGCFAVWKSDPSCLACLVVDCVEMAETSSFSTASRVSRFLFARS